MPVGVNVQTVEIPPATTSLYNTQNAFIVGATDWGPVGQPIRITSLGNAASQIGLPNGTSNPYNSRSTANSAVFDAIDELLHEDGAATPTIYVSRVVHGTPTSASIALAPTAALTFTAQYPGAGGNGLYIACTNNTSTYTITIQDASGNVLATSPALSTLAAGVAWAATTGLVTAVSTGSTLPSTAAATAMSGGNDNHSTATVADWQTALAVFSPTLGPGQVFAPGQTNTGLSGISSALGTHAQANNRVAVLNLPDNTTAATAISNAGSLGTSSVASWCGFWVGDRQIAGVTPGTTRQISPDSVIAGLCARADAATANPNTAAAGVKYPLVYATTAQSMVSGAPSDTYSLADLNTLSASGINTFQTINSQPCNYGFVTPELASADQIYWQFSHSRLRMAIVAQAQLVGQNYVFAQIDGQGSQAIAYKGALQAMLLPYAQSGALWAPPGTPPAQAFVVDTGPDVNTPATEAAGQLNATITVSFSYFAQNVQILVNVVPITQAL